MTEYVNVRIDKDTLIEMLVDRVKFWTDDPDTCELFENYYTDMVEGGCYEGIELDISVIVDNDYINYFRVMEKDDPEYAWAQENSDRIYGELENGTILVYMT